MKYKMKRIIKDDSKPIEEMGEKIIKPEKLRYLMKYGYMMKEILICIIRINFFFHYVNICCIIILIEGGNYDKLYIN